MIADTLGEGPGEVEAQCSHTRFEGGFHSTPNSLLLVEIEKIQGKVLKRNGCREYSNLPPSWGATTFKYSN
jgi:hypothetical protein